MKISLIWVGKTRDSAIKSAIDDYSSRIARYNSFEVLELKEERTATPERSREAESERIIRQIPAGAAVLLLDETGKEMTSCQFAEYIDRQRMISISELVFVIGGAYGFSDQLRRKYEKMALSKMTFTHQMVRLFFVEQLYRAFTIINKEPYHH